MLNVYFIQNIVTQVSSQTTNGLEVDPPIVEMFVKKTKDKRKLGVAPRLDSELDSKDL